MKKLENELKSLNIGFKDDSSIPSVQQNTLVESPNDSEIVSIFNQDFNEVKRIMNNFLHLGIDEKNGQFSKDVTQFANMIDVEEGLTSHELKLYRSFIDYCLTILNKYHGYGKVVG